MSNCCKRRNCQAIIKTEPAIVVKKDAELQANSDFSLGESLELVYPLLDLIFSYLSYDDLMSASEVNNSWRDVALRQASGRQQVAWFSCPGEHRMYQLKRSHSLLRSNPYFCIVLIPSWRCTLQTKLCVKYSNTYRRTTVGNYLQKHILGYPFRETVVLGSMNITLRQNVPVRPDQKIKIISLFEGIVLPKIPNVKIVFIRPHSSFKGNARAINIPPTKKINSLLVFCASNQKRIFKNFLEELLEEEDPRKVAIAGGVVTGIKKHFVGSYLCNEYPRNHFDISCVAFLEPKNKTTSLLSYSLVIPARLPEGSFMERLIKFKEKITMRSHSAAFRFCCCAKGSSRQSETSAFNTVFPKTPIIGLDVFGELGWDTVLFDDDESGDEEESRPKRMKNSKLPFVYHEWTTTLLLITWDS